jgi:hypothetical protein
MTVWHNNMTELKQKKFHQTATRSQNKYTYQLKFPPSVTSLSKNNYSLSWKLNFALTKYNMPSQIHHAPQFVQRHRVIPINILPFFAIRTWYASQIMSHCYAFVLQILFHFKVLIWLFGMQGCWAVGHWSVPIRFLGFTNLYKPAQWNEKRAEQ